MPSSTAISDDLYDLVDRTLIPHTQFERAITRIEQCLQAMQRCVDPIGLAIVGESRTGKSRALEHFETRHPPIRTADGRKVPFLRVKVPSKPTVKGLVELLLYHLGDPNFDKGTEIAKTLRLMILLERAETVILALDEFQHFYDKTTRKVQHYVADWLKVLVDDAKLGLIVTGLPSCLSVIEQNEQLDGRFMAPIHLPRFDWMNEDDREEFSAILTGMGNSLSAFEWPKLEAPEVAFRFYCATGGLIGYLTKLLKQAIWNALDDGSRAIGLPELSAAHHDVMIKGGSALQPGFDPFHEDFNSEITDEIILRVKSIGTAKEEPCISRQTSSRERKPKASEVLSGRI
ncbi:MAG TPA: TniB family NTP-binding protein [Azonexus sp.]|nr:TniB family NTP-binding protein [Azonexus sp.]